MSYPEAEKTNGGPDPRSDEPTIPTNDCQTNGTTSHEDAQKDSTPVKFSGVEDSSPFSSNGKRKMKFANDDDTPSQHQPRSRVQRSEEKATPLKKKMKMTDLDIDDSSEDEGLPDYKIGGYHPVHVGEVMNDRYVIVQKLGWGHFSTVWLTRDLKYNSWVAMKIQKSASHYIEAAYDEVGILEEVSSFWKKKEWQDSIKKYYKDDPFMSEKLADNFCVAGADSYCVQLLDCFMHSGPNGNHYVMVFEIQGVNLLEVIKRYDYKGVPLNLVRLMSKQCLIGLDFLHRICSLIHTDLKPENTILDLQSSELKEIWDKGYLTTVSNFSTVPEKIQTELTRPMYKPDERKTRNMERSERTDNAMKSQKAVTPMTAEEKKAKKNRDKKRRKKQNKIIRKRREKATAEGRDPDAAEQEYRDMLSKLEETQDDNVSEVTEPLPPTPPRKRKSSDVPEEDEKISFKPTTDED